MHDMHSVIVHKKIFKKVFFMFLTLTKGFIKYKVNGVSSLHIAIHSLVVCT